MRTHLLKDDIARGGLVRRTREQRFRVGDDGGRRWRWRRGGFLIRADLQRLEL